MSVEGEVEQDKAWKAGRDFEIDIEFRTTNDTGLIFYLERQDIPDHVELELVSGTVHIRTLLSVYVLVSWIIRLFVA